jgi:iron complex outermembrane receptor protein
MFFTPVKKDLRWFNFFAQDDITVLDDKLCLTVGCKFEHNDYTGWEIQPTARFLARPRENHVLWGAVSRAVRTPSRLDVDAHGGVTYPPPALPPPLNQTGDFGRMVIQSTDIDSEEMIACELGYRLQPHSRFWFDAAVYYSDYDNLVATETVSRGFEPVQDPQRYELRLQRNNGMHGRSYGGELASALNVRPNWTLVGAYGYLELDLDLEPGSQGIPKITVDEGNSPEHQFSLRSMWDVTRNLECDIWLRHVGELTGPGVDAYTTYDVRLAWQMSEGLELSLVGRNLAEQWHQEFREYEVERSVHGKVTCLF